MYAPTAAFDMQTLAAKQDSLCNLLRTRADCVTWYNIGYFRCVTEKGKKPHNKNVRY
jgi:hypothetical protein